MGDTSMWQAIRVVLTAIAGFTGLFLSALVIEGDKRLILTHHLDQTLMHALWQVFGQWGGSAAYLFLFVGTPALLLVSVLFDERHRWREVVRWIPIPMDEWLPPRNRDPS